VLVRVTQREITRHARSIEPLLRARDGLENRDDVRHDALADVSTKGWGVVEVPANAGGTNSGYAKLDDGLYDVQCISGFDTTFAGPSLKVGS